MDNRIKMDGNSNDHNRYSAPLNYHDSTNQNGSGNVVVNNRRSAPEFLEHNS